MLGLKIFVVIFLFFTQSAYSVKSQEFRDYHLTLLVPEANQVISEIIKKAESKGGYFVFQSKTHLRIKVPVSGSQWMLDQLKSLGTHAELSSNRVNLRPALLKLKASLDAKNETLKDYIQLIRQTQNREDVIAIQKEVNDLVLEVEQIKGDIKMKRHQAQFAFFDVSFQQRNRTSRLNRKEESDFRWINQVNMSALLGDYE